MSHDLFKESFVVPRFLWPLAREVGKIARCLNHLYGEDGAQVYPNELGGLTVSKGGALGIDLSSYSFGWLHSDGSRAIIRSGWFCALGVWRKVTAPDLGIECGGNINARHLIIAEISQREARVLPNSILETTFSGDAADAIRRPLYAVHLEYGEVVLNEVINVGAITP